MRKSETSVHVLMYSHTLVELDGQLFSLESSGLRRCGLDGSAW